ncbi:hypothetical protein TIFTF001_037035 [Ficus carica]|uniref:Uncharacterized protein n=1 Tax=Ficus carica TaxID=3494 RepID=A0AA88E5E0_FICCA|nr:hypothetical protein TIFTF001_037035 [Ficus carica]
MYLRDYSTAVHLQKEKHLKVIGTPAFPSGPGTRMTRSGRLPIVPVGQIGLRRTGAIGQVEGVGDVTCAVAGGRSLLLMCAVTGFASNVSHIVPGYTADLSKEIDPGRVLWLPGKYFMFGTSRVDRYRFRRLDIFASI